MMNHPVELILKYFPNLSPKQQEQFEALDALYRSWNEKINLVSRKDIDRLYEHHILHSLAIAKVIKWAKGTKVIDVGTGGGFPGIPLAIFFPEVRFLLTDSIQKKIKVVSDIIEQLKLNNAQALAVRSNEYKGKFDFILGRAVTTLPEFVSVTQHLLTPGMRSSLPNGYLYLKGGDLQEELKPFEENMLVFNIDEIFAEEYFQEKKIVYTEI